MTLLHKTYGKDRVRVMRIHRDGDWQEVRELTVQAMLTGEFDSTFTHAQNETFRISRYGKKRHQRGRA